MADRFVCWLDAAGYASYDPYDVWGTKYGLLARRRYYRKTPLGLTLTAPVLAMEIVCPRLRTLFVKKDRYATADAQLGLAFLNLYESSRDSERLPGRDASGRSKSTWWLKKAKDLATDLLAQSIPGYKGQCWGYPFDWENVNGLMPKGTPHITATPYCYELFARLFDVTGDAQYCTVARSIATFVSDNLNDTPTGQDSAAASYTPHDHGKVINASAYRAFVLFDAGRRFGNAAYRAKAWSNLRFILQAQRPDGSWLYAIDNPPEAFIDHFHTCFVLKNLYKINLHLLDPTVSRSIRKGYAWYRHYLFDDSDTPKSFAIVPRTQIVRLEMYNVAEAISLGVLLKTEIPEAFTLAERLAARFLRRYQVPAGHWITRTYYGGIKHTVPFMRWPQSQLFLALTNLLRSTKPQHDIVG